jgi:hypothetical protein
MHQSLHHLVADAPWNDEEMLAEVRRYVLPPAAIHRDRERFRSGFAGGFAGGYTSSERTPEESISD